MSHRGSFVFVVLLALVAAGRAVAFPGLVRHGYANCTACHLSPNGGGMLTGYGRQLSREIVSTWGTEGEEKFAYGVLKTPDWLLLGGDVRAVQTYMNSPAVERARLIFMQADLEAAVSLEKWQANVTIGPQPSASFNKTDAALVSRRHWIAYKPTEEITIRAGRFFLAYGINAPDHFIAVRRGLRWDEGGESYNVEASYLGDRYDLFVTGSVGRPDAPSLNVDSGFAIRGSTFLADKFKIGASYYYGSNPLGKRHVLGPYAILGFSKRFFLLAEIDFQDNLPNGRPGTWGLLDYLRLQYEVVQGVHVFASQEMTQLDLQDGRTRTDAYALGAQFFPRPHFEFEAAWQKRRTVGISNDYADFAWLLLHYYL